MRTTKTLVILQDDERVLLQCGAEIFGGRSRLGRIQALQTGFRDWLNRNSTLVRQAVEAALQTQPGSPPVLMVLAHSLKVAAGRLSTARETAGRVVQRFPRNTAVWTRMGIIEDFIDNFPAATDRKDCTRAIPLVQRAREFEPENPSYADTLGWLFYGMGSWLAGLTAAVKQDPQFGQDIEPGRAVTENEERKAHA